MAKQLPLAPKIGEVPPNVDKFKSWSGNHGYYKRPDAIINPYKTDKMLSDKVSLEDVLQNQSICSTLRNNNKSQVSKIRVATQLLNDQKMLGKSNFSLSFIDYKTVVSEFILHIEDFEQPFNGNIDAVEHILDSNDDGKSVSLSRVPIVVRDTLGSDVPNFILDRFVESCNRRSLEGNIITKYNLYSLYFMVNLFFYYCAGFCRCD
jgi:hypothetical protein